MTLSDADREALHEVVFPAHYDDPNLYIVAEVVEAIAHRAVTEALNEAADEAEWKFRSMRFFRGAPGCESETVLHPVGAFLRARANP